jgi:hypothetical protein
LGDERIFNALLRSVAEPHNFYAAPAPGENFDVDPAAPAPAPTIPYSRSKLLKMNISFHKACHLFFF